MDSIATEFGWTVYTLYKLWFIKRKLSNLDYKKVKTVPT